MNPGTIPATNILAEFAVALGLPAQRMEEMLDGQLFTGPSGLPCRVHVDAEARALRPEVLLPISLEELDAQELRNLLKLQSSLLTAFGWYLGPSSEVGLVVVSSPQWIGDPLQAASALDLANGLGTYVLTKLLGSGRGAYDENTRQ